MKDVGKMGGWLAVCLAAWIALAALGVESSAEAASQCFPSDCMVIPGDFNCDDGVDLVDAALFMSHWLDDACFDAACCEHTDLDLSGLMDYADYAIFADNFGTCALQWTSIGGQPNGVNGDQANVFVSDLRIFEDGGSPALYVGGNFSTAAGVAVNHIAKWDGTAWSPLGSGMNDSVSGLTVFDDGAGPALYVGGLFTNAGGVPAAHLAKWGRPLVCPSE